MTKQSLPRLTAALLPAFVAGFTLSACVTGQPELSSNYRFVPAEGAFVLPPPGGPAVLSVVERRYTNATEQRIVLATEGGQSGENYITAQFFGPVSQHDAGVGDQSLPNRPLRSSEVAKEIREAMPGVPMHQASSYVQNRYGPFAYAVGRAGSGDICLYAWQRIAGQDNSTLIMRARGTIQIRLRLCAPNRSEEQLLLTMYGLSINAFFDNYQWGPFGAPPGPDENLGRPGEPIYPTAAGGFESVLADPEPAPAPPPRPRRQTVRPAEPAVQAAPLPAAVGTPVPPPPAPASVTPSSTDAATVPSPSTAEPGRPAPPLCLPHESGEGVVCQ